MKKRYRHAPQKKMMRRSSRIYLTDVNVGKARILVEFLRLCHDVTQYFVDLFWQRRETSAALAALATVHRGRERFGITTRLAQALAKQAKECIRSAMKRPKKRKPRLQRHTVTLYYHFVSIEPFDGAFDYAIKLTGSGAPRMVIPVRSTKHLNHLLAEGWTLAKTIRLGRDRRGRLFVDLIVEKPRPALKTEGRVVGMDSNYKNGFVFSDDQVIGQALYSRIQTFQTRQKHTHAEITSLLGHALKHLDLSHIKLLAIENLKHVKHDKRGTFSRSFNRRLSHWLYAYLMAVLERRCEETGVRLERKSPWKTSQWCRRCERWDRRNRRGDQFCCVHCGYTDHADHHAAKTLELLGAAGVYGLRSLQNLERCSKEQTSE
jgi:IS605 OrfB family transposase